MMVKLFSGLFDSNEKEVKRLRDTVGQVNALEPVFEKLSDAELRSKTDEFRKRFSNGESLDNLLPEAFAAMREAAKRHLKQRAFDVQLMGAITLHQGKIAEMKTGEGKTLTATFALYLNSLAGKGAHLVTVNDYLARRDPYWMGPVFHALGVSIASIYPMQGPDEHSPARIYDPEYDSGDTRWPHFRAIQRAEAYKADITYGTSSEFGFDYLRDNMVADISRCVQEPLYYAIVDEVDNLLIDEARTPLIISGVIPFRKELAKEAFMYEIFAQLANKLLEGTDYTKSEKERSVELTDEGYSKIAQFLKSKKLIEQESDLFKEVKVKPDDKRTSLFEQMKNTPDDKITTLEILRNIDNALRAKEFYHSDKEYQIIESVDSYNNRKREVVIVDEFTGRLMHGRRYSQGLHQAIEAKEKLTGNEIKEEVGTLATITIQNYFRMYEKLAGMTGTAMTEAEEFFKIYKLEVTEIPTNKPNIRQDHSDLVYKTEEGKYRAVVNDIKEIHDKGAPVLIGTVSIEKSEYLHKMLKRQGIDCKVLNAKEHTREAEIIAHAGEPGAVTVATNMAGRGVDIILGGSPPGGYKNYEDIHDYIFKQLSEHLTVIFGETKSRATVDGYKTIAKEIDKKIGVLKDNLNEIVFEICKEEAKSQDGNPNLTQLLEERKKIENEFSETIKRYNTVFKELFDDVESLYKDLINEIGRVKSDSEQALSDFVTWFRKHLTVVSKGGLHVIGTERHEARRIDNQLRGRAGRQGDPGMTRFYVSIEDDIMKRFGGDRMKTIMNWVGIDEDTPIENKMITNAITDVQKRVEGYNFDIRKHLVEYDDVVNKHRELIYQERRKILEGADLKTNILSMVNQEIEGIVKSRCSASYSEDWEIPELINDVNAVVPLPRSLNEEHLRSLSKQEILDAIKQATVDEYEKREVDTGSDNMRMLERLVMLQIIDRLWVEHLTAMEDERRQAGWQTLRQVKSADAYRRSGFENFEILKATIQQEVARTIFRVRINPREEKSKASEMEKAAVGAQVGASARRPVKAAKKVGRNDPCPCGSGKKYKNCCGK